MTYNTLLGLLFVNTFKPSEIYPHSPTTSVSIFIQPMSKFHDTVRWALGTKHIHVPNSRQRAGRVRPATWINGALSDLQCDLNPPATRGGCGVLWRAGGALVTLLGEPG